MRKGGNEFRWRYLAENSLEGERTEQTWLYHPQNDVLCALETPVPVTILPDSQFL